MMDDSELRISFLDAKNKREQVGVLADLNVCAPREISERLDAMGLLEPEGLRVEQFKAQYVPTARGAIEKMGASMVQRATELFNDGADDLAIAEALGVSRSSVKSWRHENRLLRPRGGSRARNPAPEPAPEPVPEPAPEPVPETVPVALSVQTFLAALTEMLTPRAARGSLWLNGAPVREIASVRIRPCGDGMIVDVETEG